MDHQGRTIWIADAHRDDGKRFVVRADEKLSASIELEAAVYRDRLVRGETMDGQALFVAKLRNQPEPLVF